MKSVPDIPGPKASPLLGNLSQLRGGVLPFFTQLGRDYPDLARFRYFHVNLITVHTPELLEQVLIHQNARLHRSFDFEQIRHAFGNGILTSDGALWRRQRRLVQPSFDRKHLEAYGAKMAAHAAHEMESWRDGEVINIYDRIGRIAMAVMADIVFSIQGDHIDDIMATAIDDFMTRFAELTTKLVPLPFKTPTPTNMRIRRSIRRLDRFIREQVADRSDRDEPGEDILGRLMSARDDQGPMSPQQLRDEVVTLLFAGQDTVTLALTYTLFLLGQHPDEFARLVEEVDQLSGLPTVADLKQLPFAHRVVDESMRVYPPIWGTGRTVIEPFELAGYHLPKGTQLIVAPWITHRDHRYFDDPYVFRPDRWLNPTWPKSAYFPYILGPRKCIGAHFGRMETVLVLAALVQRYAFELVDEPTLLELMPAITLRPRHGLRVRLRARGREARASAA